MTNHDGSTHDEPLDALVSELLACGGVLSQMIGHMQEAEASGVCSPDAPPILEIAHTLIRDVNRDLAERHTKEEIRVSAEIVEQVTTAICENIFFLPVSEIRRNGRAARTNSHRRPRRRPARKRR